MEQEFAQFETLDQCRRNYCYPVKKYISCDDFGHVDGTNGSCHWCLEMTPYQWEMCSDESWKRSMLSPIGKMHGRTEEEATRFINEYKHKHFR